LPNSEAEREQLESRFSLDSPVFVVPNAVNTGHFYEGPADDGRGAAAREKTALCVGRIEPRKNQLAVIRGLRQSGLRLRVIGRAGDHSTAYERQCRREAGADVEFLGWRSPDELRRFYQASAVHVSASWYETPGLASLEAASCGSPIVVTPGGATREYFGNAAEYCAADDPMSVRSAVERAISRPVSSGLPSRIVKQFTWEIAARATLEAYRYALESPVRAVAG
jgi:glycosyltransferase involved in cell wall biosynthesis